MCTDYLPIENEILELELNRSRKKDNKIVFEYRER